MVNGRLTKISEQVTAQFLADGVQVELDPSYHIGVVDGFYNIYKLAMLNNKLDLFPSNYIELLKKHLDLSWILFIPITQLTISMIHVPAHTVKASY